MYSFAQLIVASQFLSQIDDDWAQLVEMVGECDFEQRQENEPYAALIRAVAYQQLHGKAGDAIFRRFLTIYNNSFPTPCQLLATQFDDLRTCGFSARKIETIQGIALASLSEFVPSRLEADMMSVEALIDRLTKLKGIGQWSVEILLMFTLNRLDVLPAGDLGIVQGYKRLKKLDHAPCAKQMTEIAKAYRPYRTVASWYLWRVPK